MLTLLLLRHAKSSWDDLAGDDHDRVLSERGNRAAPLMGAYLARHGLMPDIVLCSTAARTRATLDLVLPVLEPAPEVLHERGLYLADAEDLLARLHTLPGRYKRALMIGHNPGLEDLARMLCARGDTASLAALGVKFPTAGLAIITFETTKWQMLSPGSGTLERFITPRSLEKTGA